jgi:hypothetical protein
MLQQTLATADTMCIMKLCDRSVHASPLTSIHCVTYKTNTSQSPVWHTLHEKQLYSFHVQLAQGLQPGDNKLCLQSYQWLLRKKTADEPTFCVVYCELMKQHSQGMEETISTT